MSQHPVRCRHTLKSPCIDCKKAIMQGDFLKDYIEERVLEVAQYIIDSKATIRKTAKVFGVSKSTIHKDMTERLPKINPAIAEQ